MTVETTAFWKCAHRPAVTLGVRVLRAVVWLTIPFILGWLWFERNGGFGAHVKIAVCALASAIVAIGPRSRAAGPIAVLLWVVLATARFRRVRDAYDRGRCNVLHALGPVAHIPGCTVRSHPSALPYLRLRCLGHATLEETHQPARQ